MDEVLARPLCCYILSQLRLSITCTACFKSLFNFIIAKLVWGACCLTACRACDRGEGAGGKKDVKCADRYAE